MRKNLKRGEDGKLNESELYKELGSLTKDKSTWEESIPYVSSLLAHDSVKIQAKALTPAFGGSCWEIGLSW